MKKILLGTSTLLVAGFVSSSLNAAPIKLNVGGYANWYTGYVDGNSNYENNVWCKDASDFPVLADVEITFNGETTLANGLKFGAVVELATTIGSVEDQSFIYVDGAFGRVAMGKMDSISRQFHTASKDVGLLGIQDSDMSMFTNMGYDMSTDIRENDNGQTIAYISPKMAGVTVAGSYTDASDKAESNYGDNESVYMTTVAYGGKLGNLDVEADISYAKYDAYAYDFDYGISAGIRLGMKGFTLGGGYKIVERKEDYGDYSVFNVGVAYEQGAYGASLSYIHSNDEVLENNVWKHSLILASVSYNVTAGVDTFASFGYQASETGELGKETTQKAYVLATGLGLSF